MSITHPLLKPDEIDQIGFRRNGYAFCMIAINGNELTTICWIPYSVMD